MANAALIYVLLLANAVRQAQTSITSVGATVNESRPADGDFALQIQTSPAPPASGNNLSDGTASRKVTSENFQAISTNYSGEGTNKKQDDRNGERAVKSDSVFYKKLLAKGNNAPAVNPLSVAKLVWDNCETLNKDSDKTVVKQHQYDMEYTKHEIQQDVRRQEQYTNDGVKKRDTNSTAMTMWLEKYHNLLNPKSVEWKKQRTEPYVVFESEDTTIPSTTKTTVKIIPLTTRLINKAFDIVNVTVELTTENNNMKGSYTEDWFDIDVRGKSRKTKIQFGELPQRETYLVPTLKLEEGFYPFSFMPTFFDIIHPMDLPAGLIRDFVWGKLDFPFSFLQAIKVESAFLVFVVIFTCLALVIPSILIVVAFLSMISGSGDDEMETGALFPEAEETDCNDRVLAVVTAFMVLICCVLISGMVLSNEQATSATSATRDAAACLCADLATWLTAAARELHHSLVPPVDMVLQAYRDDLRNVETLLGDPIQKTIASESGIDLALESLNDVISESEDLAGKISSLRDISMQAGGLASAASDRLTDLARQLDNVKKHCVGKDVKLCDTLNSHSMEFRMKFDSILRERQLTELRSFGVEELTRAIGLARHEFRSVPAAISAQTSAVRENIFKDMESHRQSIYHSSRVLSDIVRYLTAVLHSASRKVEAGLTKFQDYEFWRWVAMLGSTILFALVMILILFAMMCGCGQAKGHAKRTLKVSAVWMCVTSFVLWTMISAVFLIAGHAEVFVCHALWESPQYKSLSSLLDRPSPLLNNEEGVFDALFRDLENVTIDVSVRDVLRDCEKDRPAYTVFQLDKVLDINKETSYFEWDDLQLNLGRLASSLDVGVLRTVSAELSRILNQMLIVSDVDLAQYRVEYNGPVVGKDMISLADQLQNVAAQVSDLTTSSRLESLATRTQRLYLTSIKPLEQLKADVVFKLTELELQLLPFRRKLNISLSHIHTAQFYIDNQGDVIAQKKGSVYASRLISHVAGWRTHVLEAAATQAGRCRPLFAVYSAARALLCSRYVASLHGWWVCGLFLGLSWCALTPLCVNLWRAYDRRQGHDAMHMSNLTSGCQETPTTALCESNNWNTPGPPPPPRSDSW